MNQQNTQNRPTPPAPRVLLSAYQCGAGMGSVSQIGWEWFSRLSAKTPVTLITHIRNREVLSASAARPENSEIIFIDTEWIAGPLWRLANRLFPHSEHAVFLLSQLDFFVYDRQARREIGRLIRNGRTWDLVHAVTPVSPSAPTTLFRTGLPLVVGPLNGGLESPRNFPELMRADSAWLYPIKKLGRALDLFIGSARRAKTILTATESTIAAFPAGYRSKCRPMLENGVDLDLFQPTDWPTIPGGQNPLKLLFVGRLIPAKAVSLLLTAIRCVCQQVPVELDVVGDGPMRASWECLSNELGLDDIVRFHGNLSLPEISDKMRECHVFCLPSVRESGGAVLLEAMAAARPVIAVAYGGPKELVDDEIGRPIVPNGSEGVIDSLADAILDIVDHPSEWRERGKAARLRAEKLYGWNAKIDAAIELYKEILAEPDKSKKQAEVREWATN